MRIAGMGWGEWLIIILIVVLVFGAGRLAGLGPALGKSIRGFRKSVKGEDGEDQAEQKPGAAATSAHQEKVEPPTQPDKK